MGLRAATWVQLAIIAALVGVIFWPSLRRLWLKTNPIDGEPNWGHSIAVPIIGLYYLYLNRDALMRAAIRPVLPGRFTRGRVVSSVVFIVGGALVGLLGPIPAEMAAPGFGGPIAKALGVALGALGVAALTLNWGLATLVGGLLLYAYGIYPGRNDYVKDMGLVLTIFGTVLLLYGWDVMKIAWFPIAFLICALPWPGLVYSLVAGPLQHLAAMVAVAVLNVTGVFAEQQGTKIFIGDGLTAPARALNVAEACAGLKSLMTFITVGAAVAFLSSRPMWQKLAITASAVPIAIFCNVMRVAGQGLLDTYVSYELSESFAHQFVGMVMLVPAFVMVLGVGWLLDQLFVEEVDVAVPSGTGGAA